MQQLTDEQEEILGLIASRNSFPQQYDYSSDVMEPFYQLRDGGFIKMQGSFGHNLAHVTGITPLGIEHINLVKGSLAQAGFQLLSSSAEAALRNIAWSVTTTTTDEKKFVDVSDSISKKCNELSAKNYIRAIYAGDLIRFAAVTTKGWDYVQARVRPMQEGKVIINNNPQFTVSQTQSQSQSQEISLGDVINTIQNSNEFTSEEATALCTLLMDASKAPDPETATSKIGKILKGLAGKSFDLLKVALPYILKAIIFKENTPN